VYGHGKIPASVRITKKLLKDAIKENRKYKKKQYAAKKIQTKMMPYDNMFGHKRYPIRFAIKLGDRLFDSRSLAHWLKSHRSLPRPWNHVKVSNENIERVRRYDRRKLYRHGKRAYDLSSSEFHALSAEEKSKRIKRALEILDSR
jgi:hypothetical protein